VVIPTRNRWPTVARAVANALGQAGVDLEVIVVVDGSTDETAARLARHPDTRVQVISLARRRGGAHARNVGICAAGGRWVAFLDDDDVWSPDKLRHQLEVASATDAGFVYAGAVHLREPGIVVRMHALPPAADLARRLLAANVIPAGASNVLATATLLRQVGGFDETLDHLADWDLWIRLAQEAPGASCEHVLVGYVEHPDNRYKLAGEAGAAEFDRLVGKHRLASAAAGVEFDGARFARGTALGHLHAGRRGAAASTYLRSAVRYRSAGNALRAPAALLGEGFRDRFAQDTRVRVGEIDWLRTVWHPQELPAEQEYIVVTGSDSA
jgi:hypothetical protein